MFMMRHSILILALVGAVALSVAAAMNDYFYGDLFLVQSIQKLRSTPWEEAMRLVSTIGQSLPMTVFVLAAFGWFFWKRQRAEYVVLGGALLSLAVNPVLKMLVDRPRPASDLVNIWWDSNGKGFPSGHAFSAMIVFGLIYYLAPIIVQKRRVVRVIQVMSVVLVLLIGISRVYLGVHWPSDVLGGFLVGGIVLSLLIRLHRHYDSKVELSQHVN